jgi:membrane protein DedA with SNARE-associated domain
MYFACIGVAVMGVLGNMTGYWFGAKSGYYLFKKEDSFWFKKKYFCNQKISLKNMVVKQLFMLVSCQFLELSRQLLRE